MPGCPACTTLRAVEPVASVKEQTDGEQGYTYIVITFVA